ncbi:DUF1643 domain-containing protein [Alcaligenes nematophilus]|uniref:DUF1643 domain-containing protein n=1 Tax=Alcaligenes TaxID=507 RepID=UPI001EF08EDA|nr:DUF1643 domain-containing protein [Alcaligenes faecalis]ULH08227.1 DUF1643 domain-containing protein [Alcaligenes faecalis]
MSAVENQKAAVLSGCNLYRYELIRGDLSDPLVFIMLNPSTADADVDDDTIESCLRFVKANGKTGLVVYNLYALRSTSPKGLWTSEDPVGVENDKHLSEAAKNYKNIVCAWGVNARDDRVQEVVSLLKSNGANLLCIGKNKHGSPMHPLYKKAKPLEMAWDVDS